MLIPLKKSYDQPRQHIKKERHYFANKGSSSQSYCFSSGHVWMWELGHKEDWALKNWCFWTVMLEKTLESSLDCKEIKPVHPKENQPWMFIERTDAEAPILWPMWRADSLEKTLMLGKIEGRRSGRQRMSWLDGSPTRWTWVWVSFGRWWRTVCCTPWSHRELDTTERLNNNNEHWLILFELMGFFFDIYPQVELMGHMVFWIYILFLVFWETSILFSTVAAPTCISINSVQGVSFL